MQKYHAMDATLFEHPGKQVYEWEIQKPSGEIRDVVFHKASFLRSDGSVGGLIGAVVGVTNLKRAAAALLEPCEDVPVPPEIRVMRAIKERFDPKNILNPGIVFA